MSKVEVAIPETEERPAPTPAPKKEVSAEVLERLAKAREALNAKRAALAEQRKVAQEYLESEKAEKTDKPKKVKTKPAPPPQSSDSDSSTDSSDTSDSEADEVNKRGKKKKRRIETRKDYTAELERMKAKYANRYKTRYEVLVRSREPPSTQRKPVVTPLTNQETVRKGATAIAKADVQQALQREVLTTTMKNLFG